MRAARLSSAILLGLLLVACEGRQAASLRLSAVSPALGEDDAAVTVVIEGDHFLPRARTDFDHSGKSSVDEGFAATLVPADPALPQVVLADVRRTSPTLLSATVPAGLAHGFYGLRVVDPFGNEATLPEVFRVVRSVRALAGFRIGRTNSQRISVPFVLEVEAVDGAGVLVDGFSGSVTLADRTGSLSPTQLGPFTLGRARTQVTLKALAGSDAIEASDGHGHTGRSNDFVVQPGLPVQLVFSTTARQLDAGACSGRVELQIQDAFGQLAPVKDPTAIELESSSDRFALYSDSACTEPLTPKVPAGASSLAFTFRARRAGPLSLKASAATLPSATLALQIIPLAASKLDFTTPSQTLHALACSTPVTVAAADAFDNAVEPGAPIEVALASEPAGFFELFQDDACTTPLANATLGPGSLSFHVRGASPGSAFLRASARSAALTDSLLPMTVAP